MPTNSWELDRLNKSVESKQYVAYQLLREDILNNVYPDGTELTEWKLCEKYNVSRSPIRNALQQLAHEGLLNLIPGKGATVIAFTIEDILEVYDLIEIMQIYAAHMLESRLTHETLTKLQDILTAMQQSCEQDNLAESARWDQEFHSFLISSASNRRLETMYQQLRTQSARFIDANAAEDKSLALRSCQEHADICRCIQERDFTGAEQHIRKHYKHIKQYYVDKLLHHV